MSQFQNSYVMCEDRKKVLERQNAEESLRMWRRKKAEEIATKEQDKIEYQHLYLKHCPYGGGAPNYDIRRHDVTTSGLHSTPAIPLPNTNRLYKISTHCSNKPQHSKYRINGKSSTSSKSGTDKIQKYENKFLKSLGWTSEEMMKKMAEAQSENEKMRKDLKTSGKQTQTSLKPNSVKKCCDLCTCACPNFVKKYEAEIKLCPLFTQGCKIKGDGGGVELVPLLARRKRPTPKSTKNYEQLCCLQKFLLHIH